MTVTHSSDHLSNVFSFSYFLFHFCCPHFFSSCAHLSLAYSFTFSSFYFHLSALSSFLLFLFSFVFGFLVLFLLFLFPFLLLYPHFFSSRAHLSLASWFSSFYFLSLCFILISSLLVFICLWPSGSPPFVSFPLLSSSLYLLFSCLLFVLHFLCYYIFLLTPKFSVFPSLSPPLLSFLYIFFSLYLLLLFLLHFLHFVVHFQL